MTTQLSVPSTDTSRGAPLDPLGPEEISAASALVRERPEFGSSTRFVSIALHEPPKRRVLEGSVSDRQVFAVLYDRASAQTVEAVVSLGRHEVVSWRTLTGVQPSVMLEEFTAEEVARNDVRWQEAMRRRGVEDLSLAMLDPWATGYDTDCASGRRLIKPLTFLRSGPDDNGYARPVEGLLVVVDLARMDGRRRPGPRGRPLADPAG